MKIDEYGFSRGPYCGEDQDQWKGPPRNAVTVDSDNLIEGDRRTAPVKIKILKNGRPSETPEQSADRQWNLRAEELIKDNEREWRALRVPGEFNPEIEYLDLPPETIDSKDYPGQSNGGIEKLDSLEIHGPEWDNLGFHGKVETQIDSQTLSEDQLDSQTGLHTGIRWYAGGPAQPEKPASDALCPKERTEEEVRAILVGLNLGPDPEPKAEHIKTTEREEYLAKRDAWAGDFTFGPEPELPISRKKAWSKKLRQALAGKKSKLDVAQEIVFALFGERGIGGSIDFMKTGDMVSILQGSDLYRVWRKKHLGDTISRNTIERALGRRR
jgi:hypothetical protein